ncbi:abscission/NoCut checkpoint regulator isoform X3 [Lagenorhynchus albirostris]|uniref:abscission/NoCut checkpoint regulator isoform X3 n=1 Tax=Lagenorhynchus albirostris TaxID=27610 RepID=UPI0028E453EF|nr:abscission/NoCut checkpoint regulator isoform X3 [Lagenorhynchus albirostris]
MENRCYGCAVKFTLFKKEYGCKNCGRAFCSGCLSFSAAVPRAGNTQQKVCKQCHEVLTRGSAPANASKWSPPQNYKKRVAALEAKQKPNTPQSHGLTQQDQVIAERLARLRQENKPKSVPLQAEIEARLVALRDAPQGSIPSTQEMEARLASLQGRVPPSQTPQLAHQPPDTRTQAQQTQDLLTELAAEVAIDESWERGGPAASIQNDLNQGDPGAQSTSCKGQATWSLEEEKRRLLAEAAVTLREENTRQERILALAKRLAVLQGRDPDRGRGWGAATHSCPLGSPPHSHPQAKLHSGCTPCQAESGAGGPCAQGSIELHPEPRGRCWGKAVDEEQVAAIRGQGTLGPFSDPTGLPPSRQ